MEAVLELLDNSKVALAREKKICFLQWGLRNLRYMSGEDMSTVTREDETL